MKWRRDPRGSTDARKGFTHWPAVVLLIVGSAVIVYVAQPNWYGPPHPNHAASANVANTITLANQAAGGSSAQSFSGVSLGQIQRQVGVVFVGANRSSSPSTRGNKEAVSVSICADGPACHDLIAASQGRPGTCWYERSVVGSAATTAQPAAAQPTVGYAATKGRKICSAATAPSKGWSANGWSELSPKGK
jgi:hypothetical protein